MKQFHRILISLLVWISFYSCLYSQNSGTTNLSQVFTSEILHRKVNYTVYLPPSYKENQTEDFPVMYLLHGLGGGDRTWIETYKIDKISDSLIAQNKMPEMIIIMPDAENSYYINDYQNITPYEDFFIKEFTPYIQHQYRINSNTKSIVCGVSMGGFGAIILAMKHPNKFSYAISLSGAVRSPEIFAALSDQKYDNYFGSIFGTDLSGNDRINQHWKQNSPYYILDSSSAPILKNIHWYIDCGKDDYLMPSNEAFHQLLTRYSIPHEFHSRPGKHNWEYGYGSFIKAMNYLSLNRDEYTTKDALPELED